MKTSRSQVSLAACFSITTLVAIAFGFWAIGGTEYRSQWSALRQLQAKAQSEERVTSRTDHFLEGNASQRRWQSTVRMKVERNPSRWMRMLYSDDEVQQITSIGLFGKDDERQFLATAGCFPFIKKLNLQGGSFNDADFAKLQKLSVLRELIVASNRTTGTGCAMLSDLPGVRSLTITSTGLANEGISCIATLKLLERIELQWGTRRSLDLKALENLDLLWHVNFDGDFKDDSVVFLGRLPELDNATLESPSITDATIEAVCKSKTITYLMVTGSITDEAIPFLIGCESLQDVTLLDCQITAAGEARLIEARPDLTVHIDRK